jgi:Ohr subfamily peroxiredoxin
MADRTRIYTARAHVTGGRGEGHGRTSDGALEVDLRLPAEMGGSGGGTNPEQLFAVGYSACFESALASAARRRGQEDRAGDVAIDASVMLIPTAERGFKLGVELAVTLPSVATSTKPSRWSAPRTSSARTRTRRAGTSTWR